MYSYVTGYYSHSDSPDFVLMHEQKFTTEEFSARMALAIRAALQTWLNADPASDEEPPLDHTHYWVAEISPSRTVDRFDDVVAGAVKWLVENDGFKLFQPDVVVKFSGWSQVASGLRASGFASSDNEHNMRAASVLSPLVEQVSARNSLLLTAEEDEDLDNSILWEESEDDGDDEGYE